MLRSFLIVKENQGPTPRNDFCRLLAHEGLLGPMSQALVKCAEDDDDLAESAKAKIVHILLLFAQSDLKVKEAIATRQVLLRRFPVSIRDTETPLTLAFAP